MKLISSIYNNSQLEKFAPYLDGVILMAPHYAYVYDDLDLDAAIEYCHKNNIEPFISITRIFMEDELDTIKTFIQKYPTTKFVVSDIGVVQLFIDMNRIQDVVFDPTTLVCNSMDLDIYASLGVDAVAMSNEIPLKDVELSYKITKASMLYHVFGRKLMFYSKRKLVSVYKEFRSLEFENTNLSLIEEKRNYNIPLFENENGTYCYRQYNICLLNELDTLSFLKYAYLESITLDDDCFVNVLSVFRKVVNKEITIEEGNKEIETMNLPIEDGFAYEDTVHVKEKIIQCEK